MFRNPRDINTASTETVVGPSVGRPPTPPSQKRTILEKKPARLNERQAKPLTPQRQKNTTMSAQGRLMAKKVTVGKTPVKQNTSILSFFKKVAPAHESLFVSSTGCSKDISSHVDCPGEDIEIDIDNMTNIDDTTARRYNEVSGAVKRRKLSSSDIHTDGGKAEDSPVSAIISDTSGMAEAPASLLEGKFIPKLKSKSTRKQGPFLSDSDTDDDMGNQNIKLASPSIPYPQDKAVGHEVSRILNGLVLGQKPEHGQAGLQAGSSSRTDAHDLIQDFISADRDGIPLLKREATSIDDWERFDNVEQYQDDEEFAEGEEFVERKWMEEQSRIEAVEAATMVMNGTGDNEVITEACPICDADLEGISSEEATRHVNSCLDGNPIPLPLPQIKVVDSGLTPNPDARTHFSKKAAVARPGQVNPFSLDSAGSAPSSAFSKLMSSKAEDNAWATAAASEQASRGKQAYQRTCPFYKIMPGFYICVDAFRYGSVQGCNAYFLSHFHSDHYIGLTSSWCHGPIYCSKVTGNLVKQQLRVDPKWVICLDFERKTEVPKTEGVYVTMIPANHCPGSSLFLFEKAIGKGPQPKVQRILHCGDFRACPAHIENPLLMPNMADAVSGKTKEQKIDVCYLDTTYLNPRYAFPPQEDVIAACSEMCVSLAKEKAEEDDNWEVVKRERAGTGMTKFINIQKNPENLDSNTEINSKPRGRLLVICGTYSIGKERICLGIARALNCKIWAPPAKMKIIAALEDPELMSRMTNDPLEAQVHMQMLMEIRAETLQEYLNSYKPRFSRIVGFRPSGWNYRPPNSRFIDSPSVATILHSENWRTRYSLAELTPQRGSTREAACFGVPYSEHSSFRELTMFVCSLNIEKVIPTVNVGSAAGRAKMKAWIDRWLAERRKHGVLKMGGKEGEVKW